VLFGITHFWFVTETVCHLSLLSISPLALPGEEICHRRSLLLILIGKVHVAIVKEGIWTDE